MNFVLGMLVTDNDRIRGIDCTHRSQH